MHRTGSIERIKPENIAWSSKIQDYVLNFGTTRCVLDIEIDL